MQLLPLGGSSDVAIVVAEPALVLAWDHQLMVRERVDQVLLRVSV